MPARSFVLALFDALAPSGTHKGLLNELAAKANDERKAGNEPKGKHDRDHPVDEAMWSSLPLETRNALERLAEESAHDLATFRKAVETWFDDTMDRVGGWYKRRVSVIVFVIALVVAGLLNADSWQMGNALWNDQAVRAAVVSKAGGLNHDAKQAAREVADVQSLKLPIGWKGERANGAGEQRDPRAVPSTASQWLGKIAGLIITAFALSLGAPFWFDMLNRFTRIRGSGLPEGGPKDRRPRTKPPAATQ
jgi:hypothetical protein